MIKEIKELRVKIDSLAQLTKELTKINSEQINKATDSLYLAKAWLGKILGELGTDSPYSNDGTRTTVKDIEPAADVNSKVLRFIKQGVTLTVVNRTNEEWKQDHKFEISHIEKVDWLREEIKKLIKHSSDFSKNEPSIELEQGFVYKYLCEARFWLGFELERIKKVKV
jgi:hypothetical protein